MPEEQTTETTTEATVEAPAASTETQTATEQGQAQQRVEDLPDWAQKIIRDTRAEAANHRTAAKSAAEQAEKGLTEKLATALGLKQDAPDPAALTQQLTAAQQASKTAAVQLAVFKAAAKQQANADALLDSNSFLGAVSSLDPAAADFPTQITDAIKTAVGQNPTAFRLAQAAGASAADHAGGSGEAGPITEQQLKQMTPEQIDKAYREGRLSHLL